MGQKQTEQRTGDENKEPEVQSLEIHLNSKGRESIIFTSAGATFQGLPPRSAPSLIKEADGWARASSKGDQRPGRWEHKE